MALRKYYGEGEEQYWLKLRWWAGVLTDFIGGLMTWPAMPFIAVEILVPLVVVCQLSTSYIIGWLIFGEKPLWRANLGAVLGSLGIIGLHFATQQGLLAFQISQLFVHVLTMRFLIANVLCVGLVTLSFATQDSSTACALSAGFLEGVQYVCSRCLADSIASNATSSFLTPEAAIVIFVKVVVIVSIIHIQQLGLDTELTRFAGIYLVSSTFFMCAYASAFFGDEIPHTAMAAASAVCVLTGICLLSAERKEK